VNNIIFNTAKSAGELLKAPVIYSAAGAGIIAAASNVALSILLAASLGKGSPGMFFAVNLTTSVVHATVTALFLLVMSSNPITAGGVFFLAADICCWNFVLMTPLFLTTVLKSP